VKKYSLIAMLLLAIQFCHAQPPVKVYKIKDGKMYLMISKNISVAALDSFTTDFGLEDLNLKNIVINGRPDSLLDAGWQIEINNNELIALSKKMGSVDNITDPSVTINLNGQSPLAGSAVKFGVNSFRKKKLFAINDSIVTFYLRNHGDAQKVILAGSFNNWGETGTSMQKTDDGWVADVKLDAGKHWYKFIIDGNWEIDHDNRLVENDGKGNDNSVYYKPNYIFKSQSFKNSKQLFVAGSFNNWNEKELPLVKTSNGWVAAVYLANGTHTYRFIADGKWSEDPENSNRFLNEFGEYNSVIRLGNAQLFKLDGFVNAGNVILVGSFNHWRDNELQMKKVDGGWELPYALGPGNYEYGFKVDGKWVSRNSGVLADDANGALYNTLIIKPNYTFTLKGFDDVKQVFIAGDFNNWSPNTYRLTKKDNEWSIDLNVDKGKHLYKFVVDGKWILDPGNTLWEQNEYGTGNSVLWIDQ
jgi:Glycogen recognition site of AMP-activated protein kinase